MEETAETTPSSADRPNGGHLTAADVEELRNVKLDDIDMTAFEIDPKMVDDIEVVVRDTAKMICAEQPDVPEPQALHDLDSFSLVQILLELENLLKMKLLERVDAFEGDTFRDLADFIVRLAHMDEIEKELADTLSRTKESA